MRLAVRSGCGSASRVTAVQAPQLFASLLSVIALVESAHTRRYFVVPASPAGKVYEILVFEEAPFASVPIAAVAISVAPVPDASVAF
jgi:hypothetical protein